ncbi:MAG TPA: phosphate-starvation-inducible PsiE family protein [Candidatus Dormibacteraeota bacterium]|nr:phosphate-starvation-inducible PsiE family protein [Candidatus Dormibacteraeota bacterium]
MTTEQQSDEIVEHGGQLRIFNRFAEVLALGERIMFVFVGLLLFVAAVALAVRGVQEAIGLFNLHGTALVESTATFIDLILLILMISEITYTVVLSIRGRGISAIPFLLIAIIATVRRVLVITIQEIHPATSKGLTWLSKSSVDLLGLSLVCVIFVVAIMLLKRMKSG